jgi:hypothetical protein
LPDRLASEIEHARAIDQFPAPPRARIRPGKGVGAGRQGRALEAALAALFELDGTEAGEPPAERRALRAALIERASVALWHLIVQREACGLRDMKSVLRDYRVPAEVAARMGAAPRHPAPAEPRRARQNGNAETC